MMNLFKYDLKIHNEIDLSFVNFIVSSKKWYMIQLNLDSICFIYYSPISLISYIRN